jgi:hypothetical protein
MAVGLDVEIPERITFEKENGGISAPSTPGLVPALRPRSFAAIFWVGRLQHSLISLRLSSGSACREPLPTAFSSTLPAEFLEPARIRWDRHPLRLDLCFTSPSESFWKLRTGRQSQLRDCRSADYGRTHEPRDGRCTKHARSLCPVARTRARIHSSRCDLGNGEFLQWLRDRITPYMRTRDSARRKNNPGYGSERFTYLPESNRYRCPAEVFHMPSL